MLAKDDPLLKSMAPFLKVEPLKPPPNPPVRFPKKQFILLSGAVYTMAFLDMHRTLQLRNDSWWYETDPFAKPFARLPKPAYYISGAIFYTAVNWLSWKMARSNRWRKLSPVPQLLSITGNSYGLGSNYR
jgi:hypothetical protein